MFSGLQSRKPDVTLDVAVNIRPRLRWFQTQNITFTICAHQTSTLGNGDESPGGQAGDCSLNSAIFLCDQSCRCSTRRRWRHEDNGISGLNVFFSVQTATRLLYHMNDEWWPSQQIINHRVQLLHDLGSTCVTGEDRRPRISGKRLPHTDQQHLNLTWQEGRLS